MANFNESEHPRGQPDNKGQFVKKDKSTGGTSVAYVEPTRARQIIATYERAHGPVENQITSVSLSKQEWARYYATISEIQAGTLRTRKTKSGNRWVILNTDETSKGTKTPPRIILDNGSYVSPRVKNMMTFATDDEMYDFIDD